MNSEKSRSNYSASTPEKSWSARKKNQSSLGNDSSDNANPI